MIPRGRWLGGLLLLALLAGCQPAPQPPIRLTVNPWVGYDPLILAREQGLVDGRRLRVIELMSNSDSLRALRHGLTDAAALTLDETLRLADEGVPLRIIALLSESRGADAVLASDDITQPAALKGKRIGVEDTAVGALVLDRILAAAGLTRADVEVVHVEAAQHAAMLKNGRLDAVVTFEPFKRQLQAQGFRVLFDSRAMPGEILDVLVTRGPLPPEREALIRQAWAKGLAQLAANPQAAAALLAPGVDLTPEDYQATLQGLHFFTAEEERAQRTPEALARQAAPLVRTLLAQGHLSRPPDWAALLGQAEDGR